MNWIIEQRWRHVLFLHWRANAEDLQKHVPFELDLFENQAICSVVPFQMDRIRFPFTPRIPFLSNLLEVNLRTYVRVAGVRGIYFFTLDTDSLIACKIAQRFFHLPYRLAKVSLQADHDTLSFSVARAGHNFSSRVKIDQKIKTKTEFDLWCTDQTTLFTRSRAKSYAGRVSHGAWPLQAVSGIEHEGIFMPEIPYQRAEPFLSATYAEELPVRFSPFERIE